MTNKSLVYILVAVMVGYMLVSAVPNQIVMYTTPQHSLNREAGESSEVELTSSSIGDNVSVKQYWDSTNMTDEDHEIWFEIANSSHGGPWNGSIEIDELGSSGNTSDGFFDINEQVADLADEVVNLTEDFGRTKSDISDVTAVAEDAVAAAEAATESVNTVAGGANSAGQAAAEAAEAARESACGLTTITMAAWWIFDILVAVAVYWFAKQRFS